MIQTEVVTAACTITGLASGPMRACRDEVFILDAGSSTELSCPGGSLEYRWTGPGLPGTFSPDPTVSVSSDTSGPNMFSVLVRCVGDSACVDSADISVDISVAELPVADAGGDRTIGACDVPSPIGTPGDTGVNDYLWSTTSPGVTIADLVDDPASPEPMFIRSVPGSYDLTLTVTALGDALCVAVDTITVTVGDGTPLGSLGNSLRAVKLAGDVLLSWPLDLVEPDRYNVHRTADKTELDKTAYLAPILNPAAILVGDYSDGGAVAGAGGEIFYYEAFGRDCAGSSSIP
jgi:hypothetical protein